MKSVKILILLLLCFNIKLASQISILDQKVDFNYKNVPLEEILADLSKRYGLRFSYVNNVIPLSQKITSVGKNVRLEEGLNDILKTAEVSFQLVNGQIVLRKNAEKKANTVSQPATGMQETKGQDDDKAAASVNSVNKASAKTEEEIKKSGGENSPAEVVAEASEEVEEETKPQVNLPVDEMLIPEKVEKTEPAREIQPPATARNLNDSIQLSSINNNSPVAKPSKKVKTEKLKTGKKDTGASTKKEKAEKPEKADKEPVIASEISYSKDSLKLLHIGFVYPLSNHFTDAPYYVNQLSFHAFAGVSRGVDGVEASGFGNVSSDFMRGAQFAGFTNIVGGPVEGVQAAGFLNMNNGPLDGAQFAGFLNVSNGEASAVSAAGFANVRTGSLDGVEAAGFINISRDLDGFQAAGFMNVARDVDGVQIAGFLNKARLVKGVQISIVNVADSVDGVSIGLLNFVRKGYRRLEIFGSESFHANLAYKLGTDRFYTIFALGGRFQEDFVWGYGLGFGTRFPLSQSWKMNIDATGYNIVEKQFDNRLFSRDTETYFLLMNYINSNNNLRIGIDKEFSRNFTLTFGPSFNVLVRSKTDRNGEASSSSFVPYSIIEISGSQKDIFMWPGFFVGIKI